MEHLPELWTRFTAYTLKKAAERGLDGDALRREAKRLADDFAAAGHLTLTPTESLALDDAVIALFYAGAGAERFTPDGVPSPVADRPDSSWMYDSDYCFINVRALSPESAKTGTFIHALKVIPTVRADSLHVAPFFDCALDNLYAVESLAVITRHVLDGEMLAAGFTADEQLRLFVDGAHLLGKTLGFDLEPHTGQFSRVALAHPEHFRWIRLSKDRATLWDDEDQEEMMGEERQQELHGEIRERIAAILKKHYLTAVEDTSRGVPVMRRAHLEALHHLIDEGYWSLPSHTWSGVGLPRYDRYVHEKNYPDFIYLNKDNEDQHEHSFGMLTPYKFHTNLPLNSPPDPDDPPVRNDAAIEFFKEIFPGIQDRFNFDYVRLDYVDHVFDAVNEENPAVATGDRMTPEILRETLMHAKGKRPYTGAMAERMGCDIKDYKSVGFDLILGIDILTTMHPDFLTYIFELQKEIEESMEDGVKASVLFAVDTHDSGHPLFWTKPLSQVVGAKGMALRHFLSRFTWTGRARRPKYECIGNQDLSHGLYDGNNLLKSVTWVGDKAYNRRYHTLENVYESFLPLIRNALLGPRHVEKEYAWWFLDRADGVRERLLCVASLEKKFKKLKECLTKEIALRPPAELVLNFRENYFFENPEILEVCLATGERTPAPQVSDWQVKVAGLGKQQARLFCVRERQ